MDSLQKILSRNIRQRRKRLYRNRSRLAHAADLDWGALQAIEQGRRMPTPEVLQRIAKALGCTVADLWEGA